MVIEPGKYRTRDGRVAVIEKIETEEGFRWPATGSLDEVAHSWDMGGFFYGPSSENARDLIERIDDEPASKPAFAVGQVWKDADGEDYTVAMLGPAKDEFRADHAKSGAWWFSSETGRCWGYPHRDLIEFVSQPPPTDLADAPKSGGDFDTLTAESVANFAIGNVAASPSILAAFASDEIEAEPDYRESAEVLAAALRMLVEMTTGVSGNDVHDARTLARLALETHAP